ncbi:hypothetical protein H5410_021514 [Solanum commersonii]|uniref:Uncharacterized protein n=1 Tax=Solanum commersonii TaxID=4109 RepID=A0A9J5ZBK3_SOLCO|nr:hypothetical protein H5410_021514 [Solanum commersonii]
MGRHREQDPEIFMETTLKSERWCPNSQLMSYYDVSRIEKWPSMESNRSNQTTQQPSQIISNIWINVWLENSMIPSMLTQIMIQSKSEAARVKVGEWFWNGRRLSLDWWSPLVDLDTKE